MFYAILLLRQAYVTALFQCAHVQNEYYTRKMNYDAMWLLMRTTVFSILMMPIYYSYHVTLFHTHIPSAALLLLLLCAAAAAAGFLTVIF